MGTANSMHIVCEALGMALPGSTPVAANSPKMMQHVREAGARIVQMVWDDLKPRDILTAAAFSNAVQAILAVGGSINTVKHMQAVASEARCGADVYALFERHAAQVPVLSAVRPVGEHSIEEFEAAGGCRAVLKRLEPMLERGALTVTGRTLGENLAGIEVADAEIIRPLERPIATKPAIARARQLAPEAGS
jgi:dihydroxy-acid dehydratase